MKGKRRLPLVLALLLLFTLLPARATGTDRANTLAAGGQAHSLAVQEKDLPDCLRVLARTDDGEIMAMRHKKYPVVGLQFHPESIYTEHGKRIIENFVNGTC